VSHASRSANIRLDAAMTYQTIDRFGLEHQCQAVERQLVPTMDLLREDLGASLYRVDIWGKSDWVDPTGELGREQALTTENLLRDNR
jgi:hypothetical protein